MRYRLRTLQHEFCAGGVRRETHSIFLGGRPPRPLQPVSTTILLRRAKKVLVCRYCRPLWREQSRGGEVDLLEPHRHMRLEYSYGWFSSKRVGYDPTGEIKQLVGMVASLTNTERTATFVDSTTRIAKKSTPQKIKSILRRRRTEPNVRHCCCPVLVTRYHMRTNLYRGSVDTVRKDGVFQQN